MMIVDGYMTNGHISYMMTIPNNIIDNMLIGFFIGTASQRGDANKVTKQGQHGCQGISMWDLTSLTLGIERSRGNRRSWGSGNRQHEASTTSVSHGHPIIG